MRAAEAISEVDRIVPNNIDSKVKLEWLRRLDMQITEEIVDTHEKPEGYQEPDFKNYEIGTTLVVPDIYAELYLDYLKMKMSLELVETDRFAAETAVYNGTYTAFMNYYNRKYMPLQRGNTTYR